MKYVYYRDLVNDDLDVIISIAPQWETVQVIQISKILR